MTKSSKKKRYKLIDKFIAYLEIGDQALDIKSYICEICYTSFKMKHHLIRHKMIHSGEKLFKCELCQTYHRDLSNLKSHSLSWHSNEKRFMCTLEKCEKKPKKFKKRSHHMTHIRTHIGYEYLCSMCNNKYSTNGNVNRHKKHKHNVLPKYDK